MHLSLKSSIGREQPRPLHYVYDDRVFDGGNVGALDQPDLSGEGNDATLYSGRFISTDGVTDKAINADCSDLGSGTYRLTGKFRKSSFGSAVAQIANGRYDTFNGTVSQWNDFTSGSFNGTPSQVVLGFAQVNGSVTLRSADDWSDVRLQKLVSSEWATVAHWQLNESADSDLDDYPAFDSSGNGYHGAHVGCAGGTGEKDILQTAGLDWNRGGTSQTELLADGNMEADDLVDFDNETFCTLTKSTAAPHLGSQALRITAESGFPVRGFTRFADVEPNVTYQFSGWARGDGLGNYPEVQLHSSSVGGWIGETSTSWQYFSIFITPSNVASGFFDLNVDGTFGTFGTSPSAGGWCEWDDLSLKRVYDADILIPELDSTLGEDALGNDIDPSTKRLTGVDLNFFETNGDDYAELPDDSTLESVRSICVAIYNDGQTTDFIQAAGGASLVDIDDGDLQSDQSGTHTYYVNGTAGTTLADGWNLVGITYNAGKDLSGGKFMGGLMGKTIAYSPKALTAAEHLKFYDSQKSKYGL